MSIICGSVGGVLRHWGGMCTETKDHLLVTFPSPSQKQHCSTSLSSIAVQENGYCFHPTAQKESYQRETDTRQKKGNNSKITEKQILVGLLFCWFEGRPLANQQQISHSATLLANGIKKKTATHNRAVVQFSGHFK